MTDIIPIDTRSTTVRATHNSASSAAINASTNGGNPGNDNAGGISKKRKMLELSLGRRTRSRLLVNRSGSSNNIRRRKSGFAASKHTTPGSSNKRINGSATNSSRGSGNQDVHAAAASTTTVEDEGTNTIIDDDIAAMNEVGIASLYAGDAMVAKESFISALSRCSQQNSVVGSTCRMSFQESGSTKTRTSTAASKTSIDQNKNSSPSLNISATTTSVSSPTPSSVDGTTAALAATATAAGAAPSSLKDDKKNANLMHVYQREEYDEGMNMYNEALFLDKEAKACKPLRDATLMYNVGQAHLRTRQYQDAMRWFSLALTTLSEWSKNEEEEDVEDDEEAEASSLPLLQEGDQVNDDDDDAASTVSTESVATSMGRHCTLLNDVMIHHNIAYCHYCLGENDHAMSHYQIAFRRLQQLGLGDLDIAACCNSIGILHLCQGSLEDSAKAMECLQLAVSIYKRVLGDQSPQVATCLSNIARVFFSRQEFQTSLALFQEALKIRQANRGTGPDSSGRDPLLTAALTIRTARVNPVDEAAAMFNIGQTYQKLGQVDLALDHFKAFRELAEPILGKGHRDVATCIKAMACIHYETGKLDTACTLLEEAVACSRNTGDEYPMELASLLRDMGCLYSMTNQTNKALDCHKESLKIQRKLYDDDHKNPNIMVTLLHIAQNEKKEGNYTKALNVYQTVYVIQLDLFGPQSLEVAATLCSIGLMLYLKQDLQSSLNYYQEALRVRQEHFKTNENFDIAATFNSIGLIAFKMNKLDLAKNAFQQCIRTRVKLEATDAHRDIVTLYSNLGTVYLANGEDKEAIQMFSESIRLERKTLGDKHLGVAVSLQHLAQLHQDRGELELAHEYFAEALKITRDADESVMANKQRTICTLLNLMGNIHLMKAEIPQMMECFVEASRVCEQDFNSLVIAGYTFYGISKMHPPCATQA